MRIHLPSTGGTVHIDTTTFSFSKEPAMKSDSELQRDARVELVRAPGVDAERIEVRVQDGVAILTGNVRSEAESWSAADAVGRVPGIQSVSNETMIARKTSVLPADADADIARPWFPPG
jgi:osmotically-inducible protein OsmY